MSAPAQGRRGRRAGRGRRWDHVLSARRPGALDRAAALRADGVRLSPQPPARAPARGHARRSQRRDVHRLRRGPDDPQGDRPRAAPAQRAGQHGDGVRQHRDDQAGDHHRGRRLDPSAAHRAERGLDPHARGGADGHSRPRAARRPYPPAPEAAHADGQPVHPALEGRLRGADPGHCRARSEELGSDRGGVVMSGEFEDEYSATIDDNLEKSPDDLRDASGALLNDTIAVLSPAEPLCLSASATVHDAVQTMLAHRQAGVLVVDGEGRLAGIFTERDVLTRVVGRDRDARKTPLGEVMTANPEALTASDRVAYAIHCMSVAGYRTIPLIDGEGRPLGVVTVSDVVRWLASLFPEAVLNLRPGDAIKRPHEVDAG